MLNRNQPKKVKPFVPYTVMLLAAVAAFSMFLGCLPPPNDRARSTPAPVVDTETPDPEMAYWREKYKKNRMTPPKDYQIMPKAPRNNQFGEFEDGLYYGLDAQPMLPELPYETAVMPAVGGPATYAMAASSYPEAAGGYGGGASGMFGAVSGEYPVTKAPAAGSAYRASSAPRPNGIDTDAHFYPIEQLVYGGDYPDIDKPESYRLMPKDVITVTVRDHPEFSGKLTVQADGTVHIPNASDLVRVRGLTVDGAADAIRRTLAIYVKGDCIVRVQANRARGGYYFVFGDVTQPGRFPMGMESITLSNAVMAANWEANPNRMDEDDELGPSFPAASPRGKYLAPRSADMARVMLITPHRSQPVRTMHDMRQALLGMTGDDPLVRPGQIIVVPSLDPEKNLSLGLELPNRSVPPAGLMPGQGFSTGSSSPRLPEVTPPDSPYLHRQPRPISAVEANLSEAFGQQHNIEPTRVQQFPDAEEECDKYAPGEYCEVVASSVVVESVDPTIPPGAASSGKQTYYEGTPVSGRGRKLHRAPLPSFSGGGSAANTNGNGWAKGF